MELPTEYKTLYRHWRYHARPATPRVSAHAVSDDTKLFSEITSFAKERMRIWNSKRLGKTPPYTHDPILSRYRFCNVFREFDRQTIEFHTLLNPLRKDFSLWLLNMFYCRMVARTDTIRSVGFLSFDTKKNDGFYRRLASSPRPRYGTPYVFPISAIQASDTPTRETFIAHGLPRVMKAVAVEISRWDRKNVYDGVEAVLRIFPHNLRFLWTEVLIDVAYQYPERIDLYGRFPIGPGSLPTMERLNRAEDPSRLVEMLAQVPFRVGLTYQGRPLRLSAENWEGIGCEFRKYTNLKGGRGRKRVFHEGS